MKLIYTVHMETGVRMRNLLILLQSSFKASYPFFINIHFSFKLYTHFPLIFIRLLHTHFPLISISSNLLINIHSYFIQLLLMSFTAHSQWHIRHTTFSNPVLLDKGHSYAEPSAHFQLILRCDTSLEVHSSEKSWKISNHANGRLPYSDKRMNTNRGSNSDKYW